MSILKAISANKIGQNARLHFAARKMTLVIDREISLRFAVFKFDHHVEFIAIETYSTAFFSITVGLRYIVTRIQYYRAHCVRQISKHTAALFRFVWTAQIIEYAPSECLKLTEMQILARFIMMNELQD